MFMQHSDINKYHIINLGKRIDASSAPDFETQCGLLLENKALHIVVLDMRYMEYISSAGLKVILYLAQTLRPRQGVVHFVSPQPQVREIFSISGFLSLFREFPSVEAALESAADSALTQPS